MFLLQPLIKLYTGHYWQPDVKQEKVILLLLYHILSYLTIDSNIHLKPFTGKDSQTYLADCRLSPEVLDIARNVFRGIMELAMLASNSNSDSNSLGGILIHFHDQLQAMPEMKPRTKAPKAEQLAEELQGELATYENVGLFQRSVNERTAYRYRVITKEG